MSPGVFVRRFKPRRFQVKRVGRLLVAAMPWVVSTKAKQRHQIQSPEGNSLTQPQVFAPQMPRLLSR